MASKSIDALASRFMTLAKKTKLAKSERNEARQLMVLLKEAGLSNEEISQLSGGKWLPNSIKHYSKGFKAVYPTQCDGVVQLLQSLNVYSLTLGDVEKTVATSQHLKSLNIPLDGITDVLFAAESSSMDIGDMVHQHKTFKENGLSLEKVLEVLDAKQYLGAMGLGLDSLVSLFEAIKVYGDPPGVLQAITLYNSLLEIKQQVKAAEEGLEEVKAARIEQESQIKDGKEKLAVLAAPIEEYRKVMELGFDDQALIDLATLSEEFRGPKAVILACKAYVDYKNIENNLVEAQTRLSDLKSDIAKRQSEYSYLTTSIDMCLKLLNEFHFGLDGIEMLLSAAKRYGDPMKVLEAIEVYGMIQALKEEEDKQRGIVGASKQIIAQLEGEYEDTLGKLRSLNALALQVGGEVSKVHCQAADSTYINQLLKLINDPYGADFGTHLNAAMVVGRAVKAFVTKYESNFKHRAQISNGLAYLIADLGGIGDINE